VAESKGHPPSLLNCSMKSRSDIFSPAKTPTRYTTSSTP
jgi:hypothetical protein